MRLLWFLFLLLLGLFGCKKKSSLENTVSSILQTIPEKDYQQLDAFFQVLVRNHFAYTLFGRKPMSVCDYISGPILFTLYRPKEFLILEKGWETWQRYCACFPSSEFVVKKMITEDDFARRIFLIHKNHALQAIENHLATFQSILGCSIDPKQFVERLCDPNEDISETLQGHANLFGILFGYGEVNAMNFERMTDICEYLNEKMTPPFSSCREIKTLSPDSLIFLNALDRKMNLPSKSCRPSPQYFSLAEELNDLRSQRTAFELNSWVLSEVAPPSFVCTKQDPETETLRKNYRATMKKLRRVYREKSFLEVTLTQWMDPQ